MIFKRKRVMIDPRLQGAHCLRLFFYWVVWVSISIVLLVGKQLVDASVTPAELTAELWPKFVAPLCASIFFLPLVLLDGMIFSNRFAGPFYRFQKELTKINDGDEPKPIHLRPEDYGHGVADEINRMIGVGSSDECAEGTAADAPPADAPSASEISDAAEVVEEPAGV